MSPRQLFQLSCKIVGLVLLCQGMLGALTAITLFFHEPDAARMVPAGALGVLPSEQVRELRAVTSYAWTHATEQLFLVGIIPMIVGGYLLRAENIVVRLCYPKTDKEQPSSEMPDPALRGDPNRDAPDAHDTPTDESRYAPPGYGPRG
ncbi:MAG TPA: hypothetical protein DCM87_02270 [Planctomycetes bacterium]|nr:hypothetical protein [Planctomycetota bacterium]